MIPADGVDRKHALCVPTDTSPVTMPEDLLAGVLLDPHVSPTLACLECCLPADLCPGHPEGGGA